MANKLNETCSAPHWELGKDLGTRARRWQVSERAWPAVDRKVAFPFPHPLSVALPTSHCSHPLPLPARAIKYLPTAHEDRIEPCTPQPIYILHFRIFAFPCCYSHVASRFSLKYIDYKPQMHALKLYFKSILNSKWREDDFFCA